MSRRSVRRSTPRRSASSMPPQKRCPCRRLRRRSNRAEVSSIERQLAPNRGQDRSSIRGWHPPPLFGGRSPLTHDQGRERLDLFLAQLAFELRHLGLLPEQVALARVLDHADHPVLATVVPQVGAIALFPGGHLVTRVAVEIVVPQLLALLCELGIG